MDTPLSLEIHREGEWFVAFCAEISEANGQGRSERESIDSLCEAILLLEEDTNEELHSKE
jgi:predicted RNase H-like HicB family nuclease